VVPSSCGLTLKVLEYQEWYRGVVNEMGHDVRWRLGEPATALSGCDFRCLVEKGSGPFLPAGFIIVPGAARVQISKKS